MYVVKYCVLKSDKMTVLRVETSEKNNLIIFFLCLGLSTYFSKRILTDLLQKFSQ